MKKVILLAALFITTILTTQAQSTGDSPSVSGNGSTTANKPSKKQPQKQLKKDKKPKKKIVIGVPTLADLPQDLMETYAAKSTGKMGDKYRINRQLVGLVTFKKLPETAFMFANLRYDLLGNDLEVILNGVRRYLRSAKVKKFTILDGFAKYRFINTDFYDGEIKDKKGYFEIIEDGDVQLLKKTSIIQQVGSYNIAKSVGNKYGRVFQKQRYYLAKGEKLYPVKGKKQTIKLFNSFGFDTEKVIKENKLKVRRISNLKTLVKIYNGQVKK